MSSANEIIRSITIKAPRSRVWQALTDYKQFSAWFRIELREPFRVGHPTHGVLTFAAYEGRAFTIDLVERMEPETFFSWRWHPFAMELDHDYSQEPTTLVTFELSDVPEGTKVVITESGFDALPPHRIDPAFRANGEGWSIQADNIRKYVER